jgi:hypothetical protein
MSPIRSDLEKWALMGGYAVGCLTPQIETGEQTLSVFYSEGKVY